jgi:hypothetical protein
LVTRVSSGFLLVNGVDKKMTLFPIQKDFESKWDSCAPAAIAAITGMGTLAARTAIKEAAKDWLGKETRRVTHMVYHEELLKALELYGYMHTSIFHSSWLKGVSLGQALHKYKPSADSVFLIRVQRTKDTGHVITCDGTRIVDNWCPTGAEYFNHPFINAIVTDIHEIRKINSGDL